MKYILIAITVFTLACKNNGGENFTVTGKIKNAPINKVYLEQLSYSSTDAKPIDSAILGADGSYKLKGTSPQQNLFVIGFSDNPFLVFVNDANNINIDYDVKSANYPVVNGSAATKE